MKTSPTSSIVIVRIIDRQSDPMVGMTCALGQAGMICWDPEQRKFNPHTQVLVQPKTHIILGLDPNSGQR